MMQQIDLGWKLTALFFATIIDSLPQLQIVCHNYRLLGFNMQAANQDEMLLKDCADIIARLKDLEKSEKWVDNGENLCKMYKMEIDGRLASKGIHVNQFHIEKVIKFLEQEQSLAKINPQLLQIKVLYQKPEAFKVNYMRYKGQWPVSDRDFVSISVKQRQNQSRVYIGVKGCSYPHPEVKGVVRGEVYIGGYIIEKVDESHTKVTYISDADLKGSIPGMLKNALSVKQGGTASKVAHVMKKEGY